MTATALLVRHHRKILELIQELRSDGHRRTTLLSRVIEELSAHIAIEENLLFPVAQRALGLTLKAERETNAQAKQALRCLATSKISGDAFLAKVDELTHIFEAHVALEEATLMPALVRKLSTSALEELGDDMDRLSAALVTRSRPPRDSVRTRTLLVA